MPRSDARPGGGGGFAEVVELHIVWASEVVVALHLAQYASLVLPVGHGDVWEEAVDAIGCCLQVVVCVVSNVANILLYFML